MSKVTGASRRMLVLGIGPIDPPIGVRDDYLARMKEELSIRDLSMEDGDVIAIASKVVAYGQGRVERIDGFKKGSELAELMHNKYRVLRWKANLILKEADRIIGGYSRHRYVLTVNNGLPVAKAGADTSNAPRSHVVLHPLDPMGEAKRGVMWAKEVYGARIGALIVDTKLSLFRRGVVGAALGYWGFGSLFDYRGMEDIFGRTFRFTVVDVADGLASAAGVVMGEGDERTPFVLIRGAPIELREDRDPPPVNVEPEECFFYNSILNPWRPEGADDQT